ncbi:MAG: response regulator [Thermotaleaceae bacterium]
MIEVMVVDDEWYNLEEVSEFIEKTDSFHVVGKYQNPLKALAEAVHICPQVVFIDIELPEMDGITLAEKLLELNSSMMIVFITSYNQYAVQAFDLNAIDYILKPIKKERFNRMVEKIKNEINFRSQYISNNLKIKALEELVVTIGEIPVKWQRTKAKEVFAYLLMHHGSYVHKEKIIENLWPNHEPEKALQILQTSICKIRNLFSQIKNVVKLEYSSNGYCLFIEEGECDYFQIQTALSNYKNHDKTTYDGVEKAGVIFRRGLLTDEGYLWSLEKEQQLREALLMNLNEIMHIYLNEGSQHKFTRVLKIIIKLDSFAENADSILPMLYELSNAGKIEKSYLKSIIQFCEQYNLNLKDLENYETHLSEREIQVLRLLSQGMTRREIADQLYFSVSSVKKHMESIYRKLGVNNKISAVQKAQKIRII